MAMIDLTRFRNRVANILDPNRLNKNLFNEAFLFGSGGYTEYNSDAKTYLEKGYNVNPIVYSVINQQSIKTASIPSRIKNVKNEKSLRMLESLNFATKGDMSQMQKMRQITLETKAFEEDDLLMPMAKPNVNQNWSEFWALWKTFMKLTGNAYIYMLTPDEGQDAGTPIQIYLLPSHLIRIVIKKGASMLGTENPIKSYLLTEGQSFIEFQAEDVIHTKYSNPNYGTNGEHLYGMSPLRAALKNIQSSNIALDLNIKTLKSGGAFGFIHAKNTALTEAQAKEIKSRLLEMNNSPEDLSKIAGVSADIGFTRLSLTSDELKPFDYLSFDQKQICNVLGWDDKLLNSDAGAKYDNMGHASRRVITDNIMPDLKLLSEALNKEFLPRFKGYENAIIMFDASDLPEMQVDMEQLVKWLRNALDGGVISRNEFRLGMRYTQVDNDDMDRFTVQNDVISLEESLANDFVILP